MKKIILEQNGKIIEIEVSDEVAQFEKDDFWKQNYQKCKHKNIASLDDMVNKNSLELCGIYEESIEEKVTKKITDEELMKVVAGIPLKQRKRIEMRYLEDLTIPEIAKVEKCTERNINYSICASLKKLKNSLKKFFLFMFLICILYTIFIIDKCTKSRF